MQSPFHQHGFLQAGIYFPQGNSFTAANFGHFFADMKLFDLRLHCCKTTKRSISGKLRNTKHKTVAVLFFPMIFKMISKLNRPAGKTRVLSLDFSEEGLGG